MRLFFVALIALTTGSFFFTGKKAEAVSCYAYTRCAWGGAISCQTWGQGCTWYTLPGAQVRCTGLNAYGQWVDLFFHC